MDRSTSAVYVRIRKGFTRRLLLSILLLLISAPRLLGEPGNEAISPTAALLREWIVATRDAALESGTEPIPAEVRSALANFFPDEILDKVRWQQASKDAFAFSAIFYVGHAPAITLDYVVVFESAETGAADPKLWAHELVHVMQFRRWGIGGFAQRYVEDYAKVEEEAAEMRWQWMKKTGRVPG